MVTTDLGGDGVTAAGYYCVLRLIEHFGGNIDGGDVGCRVLFREKCRRTSAGGFGINHIQ